MVCVLCDLQTTTVLIQGPKGPATTYFWALDLMNAFLCLILCCSIGMFGSCFLKLFSVFKNKENEENRENGPVFENCS